VKLIVGLGNPGKKYQYTRHNIGFMIIDEWLDRLKQSLKFSIKYNAEYKVLKFADEQVCIAKPMTYMNLSGDAVIKLMKYYNIEIEDVLIIVDDINLEPGKLRLRELGGHGGHNGLRHIIGILKSEQFKRIRIGVGHNQNMALDHYVLGQFKEDEKPLMRKAGEETIEALEMYVKNIPFKDIMTKFNTRT
jgi:peptidyl-tRNA hydrolase, PTH1 family